MLLLNNSSGMPNGDAGTAQGVDNIEVSRHRTRLFEAWVQQDFAGAAASVRAGLYDLNGEFYANDSAGLLIAPAFGISSELAATGANGPSVFPSTALAMRLKWSPPCGSASLSRQAAQSRVRRAGGGFPGAQMTLGLVHDHDRTRAAALLAPSDPGPNLPCMKLLT